MNNRELFEMIFVKNFVKFLFKIDPDSKAASIRGTREMRDRERAQNGAGYKFIFQIIANLIRSREKKICIFLTGYCCKP